MADTIFLVLYYGKNYFSTVNVPWHYPYGYLLAVTPIIIIFFFFAGLIKCIKDTITLKNRYSGLLIAWFFVPLLKYIDPKMGVTDGIRHFLEVVFPLSILAGLGAAILIKRTNRIFFSVFTMGLFGYLMYGVVSLHPYETAYYSEWIGGISGANNKFDIEYYGNALKEGTEWINKNTEQYTEVAVPLAQHLALKYARPNLVVVQYPTESTKYLMFMNRKSFFSAYRENGFLYDYINNKKPIYVIKRQDTPLLWIYRYP